MSAVPRSACSLALALVLALVQAAAAAQHAPRPLVIEHQSIGCVPAGLHLRVVAHIEPPESVARARVLFRAPGSSDFYAVTMRGEGGTFSALLPRPRRSLGSFEYAVEVIDLASNVVRSDAFTPAVRASAKACGAFWRGSWAAASDMAVEGPPDAPPLPPGFEAPAPHRAGRAGAIEMGTRASLAASAGVLTGAAAAAAAAANHDLSRVVVTFTGSDPPPGSRLIGTNPRLSLRFHIEPHEDFDGVDLTAGMTIGPPLYSGCALLIAPPLTLRRGQPVDVVASGGVGACAGFGATRFVRVQMYDRSRLPVFLTQTTQIGPRPFEVPFGYARE
jgi:hypothetical protein